MRSTGNVILQIFLVVSFIKKKRCYFSITNCLYVFREISIEDDQFICSSRVVLRF